MLVDDEAEDSASAAEQALLNKGLASQMPRRLRAYAYPYTWARKEIYVRVLLSSVCYHSQDPFTLAGAIAGARTLKCSPSSSTTTMQRATATRTVDPGHGANSER